MTQTCAFQGCLFPLPARSAVSVFNIWASLYLSCPSPPCSATPPHGSPSCPSSLAAPSISCPCQPCPWGLPPTVCAGVMCCSVRTTRFSSQLYICLRPINKMKEAIVYLATAFGPEQFSLKFAPCACVVARFGWIVLRAENRLQNNSSNCLSFPCWTQ